VPAVVRRRTGMSLLDIRDQAKRRSPEEMLAHLNSFSLDLKFTAGVWFFAPGGGRWHERYVPDMTMEERLEKAVGLMKYGLVGVEGHYPNEVNEGNLDLFKKYAKDAGLKLVSVVPNLFYDAQFETGSLSSPIEKVRKAAIERTKITLQINKELDTAFAIVWPGGDGFENPFGLDFYGMWDRFEEGLAEAMDAVPGVRVAIEPKPYEPRGVNIWRHTPNGILMGEGVERRLTNEENKRLLAEGHKMVTLNPEIGHVLMGFEDLPYALASVMREARLAHTHWNSQPLGNYDQDLDVGVVSPEQAEAALYTLKMYGYKGLFGLDLAPERLPVERALINSMDALKAMNDRINALDHEKVLACTNNPTKNRGYLEAMLIRARAQDPSKLSPMPEFES
jgi:xylose isomerase